MPAFEKHIDVANEKFSVAEMILDDYPILSIELSVAAIAEGCKAVLPGKGDLYPAIGLVDQLPKEMFSGSDPDAMKESLLAARTMLDRDDRRATHLKAVAQSTLDCAMYFINDADDFCRHKHGMAPHETSKWGGDLYHR